MAKLLRGTLACLYLIKIFRQKNLQSMSQQRINEHAGIDIALNNLLESLCE